MGYEKWICNEEIITYVVATKLSQAGEHSKMWWAVQKYQCIVSIACATESTENPQMNTCGTKEQITVSEHWTCLLMRGSCWIEF